MFRIFGVLITIMNNVLSTGIKIGNRFNNFNTQINELSIQQLHVLNVSLLTFLSKYTGFSSKTESFLETRAKFDYDRIFCYFSNYLQYWHAQSVSVVFNLQHSIVDLRIAQDGM